MDTHMYMQAYLLSMNNISKYVKFTATESSPKLEPAVIKDCQMKNGRLQ